MQTSFSSLTRLLGDRRVQLVVTAVSSSAAASAITYVLMEKKFEAKYAEIAQQEIEEAKSFYARLYKKEPDGSVKSPSEVYAELHGEDALEALKTYSGDDSDAEVVIVDGIRVVKSADLLGASIVAEEPNSETGVHPVEVVKNVFTDPPEDDDEDIWDYDEELKKRGSDRPFIISLDEYEANEEGFEQLDLTYYEGDDTLADDNDMPIQGSDAVVGDDNLQRFGHGSEDPNVVYVRNPKNQIDWAVTKSTGMYAREVLGLTEDDLSLEHSDQRGIRRFRSHHE